MFSRSPYCQLHQKILKNKTVDLFNAVRLKSDQHKWELLTQELTKRRYEIKLNDLSELLDKYSNLTLSKEQMEAIWETFKVKKNIEENPEDVAERLVTCKALVSSGLTRKARRVDELISMQKEADFVKENKKLEGLVQVD